MNHTSHRPDPTEPPGPVAASSGAMGRAAAQARRLRAIISLVESEVAAGRPADAVLTRYLRDHREMGSRDRRLASSSVFSLFRWRGWAGSAAEVGPAAIIRAALIEGLVSVPDALHSMAHGSTLDSCLDDPPGFQGLDDRAAWVSKHWKPDAVIADLVPDWVPSQLMRMAGTDGGFPLQRWIESVQTRPPLWLRAEGLTGADLAGAVGTQGMCATPHDRIPRAVRVDGHPLIPELEKRIGPRFWVQDLASQAVGEVCAPRPGESWWDVCAGAGGKTLDLLARLQGRGFVRATDIRESALTELRRRVERCKGPASSDTMTDFRVHDATTPAPDDRRFDGVLVDAPCSGIGTWGRNPDARWRTPPDAAETCARLQLDCLIRAADAVRPGGALVYSVCTLTHAECDGVVDTFLERHPDYRPAPIPHPLTAGPAVDRVRVLPWESDCIGMFIVRFTRS